MGADIIERVKANCKERRSSFCGFVQTAKVTEAKAEDGRGGRWRAAVRHQGRCKPDNTERREAGLAQARWATYEGSLRGSFQD